MDKKINLIPDELTVSSSVTRSAKSINKFSLIMQIILLCLIVLMISVYVYQYLALNKLNSEISILKSEVTALEQTEQQFALTKDKLSKINYVFSAKSADIYLDEYKKIKDRFVNFPSIIFKEVQIDKDSITISVQVNDIGSVFELLKSLKDVSSFGNITLTSVGYSLQKGFLINIKYYGIQQ